MFQPSPSSWMGIEAETREMEKRSVSPTSGNENYRNRRYGDVDEAHKDMVIQFGEQHNHPMTNVPILFSP